MVTFDDIKAEIESIEFGQTFNIGIEKDPAPTTILSKAIEQVEQMGNYGVMVALVDRDRNKPKEERLYTFTDIESKKLREVIYKEIEEDM